MQQQQQRQQQHYCQQRWHEWELQQQLWLHQQ
jgi:hypothetical protein